MSAKPPKYDWPLKWPDEKRLTRNWLGLILFGVACLTIFPAIYVIFRFYGALIMGSSEDVRNVGLIFLAVVGAPFVIWRAIVAQGNLDRSKDRDYADLFTKAVEQLGATREVKRQARWKDGELKYEPCRDKDGQEILKDGSFDELLYDRTKPIFETITEPNTEVRLGAIYALERISQDSERDHISTMNLLTAYLQEHASAEGCKPLLKFPSERRKTKNLAANIRQYTHGFASILGEPPRSDVQAIMTVLGRRSDERISFEIGDDSRSPRYRLDLRKLNLRRVQLDGLQFPFALFGGSYFEGASLVETQFTFAEFEAANFEHANLSGAHLDHANLSRAHFEHARLLNVNFRYATLLTTLFDFADARGAEFSHSIGVEIEELESFFGNAGTVLPAGYEELRPSDWTKNPMVSDNLMRLGTSIGSQEYLHWLQNRCEKLSS